MLSMAVCFGAVYSMIETSVSTEFGHVQIHAAGFEERPQLEVRLHDGMRLGREIVQGADGVRAWAPRVRTEGLIYSPRASASVRLIGIDPGREAQVTSLETAVVSGTYLGEEQPRALIGELLAERLQVGVGKKIVVSTQDVNGAFAGKALRVSGLFRTASIDFDGNTVFVTLDEAQDLLSLDGAISEIAILAEDPDRIPSVQESLEAMLPGQPEVRTWRQLQPLLVSMIDFLEVNASVLYSAIYIAMSFGIANVLLMSISERIPEIGMMLSMGMRPGALVRMVVLESVFLGILGFTIGLGLSWLVVGFFSEGIDLSRFADTTRLFGLGTRIVPVLRPVDVIGPALGVLATTILASVAPAFRAVRVRPVEALRHV